VQWILKHKLKLTVFCLLSILYWSWLPDKLFTTKASTVLLAENNELLAAHIADDGQWRFAQSDSVPKKFEACVLAFEDAYFYYHPGVNPVSIINSFKRNLKSGSVKSGASTITMQLARMMRNKKTRTYSQKFIEVLLALRIELSYKKKSILNIYCSNAPFGSNVVGLSAAAWRYFGKNPNHLSWAEAATLAVLPNAPALIYPGKNQHKLLQKRNRLLKKLTQKQIIDSATYSLALLEPLPQKPFPLPRFAPHLLARCSQLYGGSQTFHATIKTEIQTQVNSILNAHIQTLQQNQISNACAIVAETVSGKIFAYVGNSFSKLNANDNYVDIINAPRSTGSILKPFLYAFMLDENRILPSALIEDIPLRLGAYSPKNFNLTYDGLVPANQAIARSLNIPAVNMLRDYGIDRFHQRLKQLGFSTFNKSSEHYGLSLILGGGEATLFEVASAYASMGRALANFSNHRKKYATNSYRPLHFIKKNNNEKNTAKLNSDLLKASSIYFTFNAMTELLRPQDYIGYKRFASKQQLAWKTGTSFGFRDAWAVGLNEKYIVAVWVGNADGEGRPELTGTAAAAPLMFSIFNVLSEKKWFNKPTITIEKIEVCKQSGFRASDICPEKIRVDVPLGSEKSNACTFHQLIHCDESAEFRVNSSCYPVSKMKHKAWFVISPLQEYYYKKRNISYKSLPPYLPGCDNDFSHRLFELVYPKEGFQIYIPKTEDDSKSTCVFKATHKNSKAQLFWHLDGNFIGTTESYHQLSINPPKGKHLLEITDESGESIICNFEILTK